MPIADSIVYPIAVQCGWYATAQVTSAIIEHVSRWVNIRGGITMYIPVAIQPILHRIG